MPKITNIQNMSEWIQKSLSGQVKVGNLPLEKKNSFNKLVSRYNTSFGILCSRFVHYSYNTYAERVVIVVVSLEQHLDEIKNKENEKKWRKFIPKGFYSREHWENGSVYE